MMDVIYQLTFFAALALFAILITVFVFAVSLLGRALETAARSEKEKITERKENNAKEMVAIKKEIEKAEAEGEIPTGLIQTLEELKRKDKNFNKELSKIRRAPELLTVRVGVVHPGICLTLALILSGGAWLLRDIGTFAPETLWLLGLAAIGYSTFRIYKSLRVIESVAITSEAEAERRLARAVKTALAEVEEEKKPKLELEFEDVKLPFHVEAGSEVFIKFTVGLSRGDIARNAAAILHAPPVFKFPDSPKGPRPSKKYANYVSTEFKLGNITKPIRKLSLVKLKVPSQPNSYTVVYRLYCEGFDSDYEEFEVIVE